MSIFVQRDLRPHIPRVALGAFHIGLVDGNKEWAKAEREGRRGESFRQPHIGKVGFSSYPDPQRDASSPFCGI
jgi:hypothetical protein